MQHARTPSPPRYDRDRERTMREPSMSTQREKVIDAHEREVAQAPPREDTVDLLHFPPGLEVNSQVANESSHKQAQMFPISFRPQRRGDARTLASTLQRGPLVLADVLESNARLVEWSDGSKTVMVGEEHFDIISDRLATDYYLFRKGADVQTVDAAVGAVGRLQPYNLGGLMGRVSVTPLSAKSEGRKVMLTMKDGGEQEEKLAKEEAERKERDRARRENKRRQTMASQPRPRERPSPRYESEEDMSDDEADRFAEEQERRIKRQRMSDWGTKKAGRRKIVGDSDEEESDD